MLGVDVQGFCRLFHMHSEVASHGWKDFIWHDPHPHQETHSRTFVLEKMAERHFPGKPSNLLDHFLCSFRRRSWVS